MSAAQHIIIFGVRLYRCVVSPAKAFLIGPFGQCRFTPSCSAYALEALARHGALAGSWLALKRIGRCHPWGGCGEDLVPESKSESRNPGLAPRGAYCVLRAAPTEHAPCTTHHASTQHSITPALR